MKKTRPRGFARAILEEIAELQRASGITQEQMAKAIGRTQPHVSNRLHGERGWTSDEIDALADLFNIDVFELISNASRRIGTHPDTPLNPTDMTVAQIENLPNTAVTKRKKPDRP